jgi:argininosuccinate synthase
MNSMAFAQATVNGTVKVKLFKGVAYAIARKSPNSLYNPKLSSMDEEGGYNQMDADGFIKINAIRLKANYFINKGE